MMSDFAVLRDTFALEHYAERLPVLRELVKTQARKYRAEKRFVEEKHNGKWSAELRKAAFDLQDTLNEIANIERDTPIRQSRLAAQQRKVR